MHYLAVTNDISNFVVPDVLYKKSCHQNVFYMKTAQRKEI